MQSVEDYYRHCPNQPQVLISDAVCFGRRRASYPFCPGCQFNDDERGRDAAASGGKKQTMIERVFKAYDVRATYPDMLNEDAAWRIGFATASFLHTGLRGLDRAAAGATTVVVGRDMRLSSPSLSAALIEGIRATGSPVIDIGMIDTPQLYFAINHLGSCGGIQTTASHNPAHYNGFKISALKGAPVGSDTGLSDVCKIAQNTTRHDTGQEGPLREVDLAAEYKAFVRSHLETPRKLRICIDASNGMAGKWVPILFDDVNELDLVYLNMETTGEFVHEPNPLVEANLAQLRESVRWKRADFGICFDGDADRLIVVDENADVVSCDLLTALLAKRFLERAPGATVVYDLRSSRVVAEEVEAAGGVPRRERVGHAFMKKALSESRGVFGGELSGHFYFKDNYYCDSAVLAMAQVINILTREGRSLSELIAPLRRYHGSGECNFENTNKDQAIMALGERYGDGRVDYLDGVTVQYSDWWFNVRKSNTEPLLRLNVEANTPELLEAKLAELAPQLGEPVEH
jgi:phosphomannomutase